MNANLFYFPSLERAVIGKLNILYAAWDTGGSAGDKIALWDVGKGKITLKLAFQKWRINLVPRDVGRIFFHYIQE